MSRAFVKESDGDEALAPLRHVDSGKPNYITASGKSALARRIAAQRETRDAIAGDTSRLDAKAALAQIDADIAYLEERLERAIVVATPEPPWRAVGIGAEVEAIDENGLQHRFQVVGEDEVDVARGRVSWLSPLGDAVLGHAVGEFVDWVRPAGEIALEITAIHYHGDDTSN